MILPAYAHSEAGGPLAAALRLRWPMASTVPCSQASHAAPTSASTAPAGASLALALALAMCTVGVQQYARRAIGLLRHVVSQPRPGRSRGSELLPQYSDSCPSQSSQVRHLSSTAPPHPRPHNLHKRTRLTSSSRSQPPGPACPGLGPLRSASTVYCYARNHPRGVATRPRFKRPPQTQRHNLVSLSLVSLSRRVPMRQRQSTPTLDRRQRAHRMNAQPPYTMVPVAGLAAPETVTASPSTPALYCVESSSMSLLSRHRLDPAHPLVFLITMQFLRESVHGPD